ncbi:hypothetical protein BDD12DRAFT_279622 [Trichophaea hybrida]|nr:hypothetical protein BDD12DRAFT_279622 [Trichophaea hybrida]
MTLGLPNEWTIGSYGLDSPLILLGFEYEMLAMRCPTDATLRAQHRGRWMYLYDDEGDMCFYYLGREPAKVAANMEMITTDWAAVKGFPKVSWLSTEMREWLDSAHAAPLARRVDRFVPLPHRRLPPQTTPGNPQMSTSEPRLVDNVSCSPYQA